MIACTLRRFLAATVAAILTAVRPLVPDGFGGANPFDAPSAAARKGGDNSGSGSGGGGGDDNSGSGSDNSGPGGGDDGGNGGDNNSGPGGGDDDGDNDDDDSGRSDGRYIDGATGARIEVDGGNIEIVYPDGWKEELENGIFELKDPAGRTVIERRATREDVARLRAIAN
jgi:hypothetical protein